MFFESNVHSIMNTPKTELTLDETLRVEYLQLLSRSLKQCKKHDPYMLDFTEQEKHVIEYYLKDVAQNALLAHTSIGGCLSAFINRLTRLVNGKKESWERTIEIFENHKHLISEEEIKEIKKFSRYFKKKRATIA